MKDYQQRVITEKRELDQRLGKLTTFLQKPALDMPGAEMDRLHRQHDHMTAYSAVLGERIEAFKA